MISLQTKKILGGGVALAILVGLVGFIVTSQPVSVRTVKTEHDVPVRVFGLGTVEAQVISKVGFEVGAALVELAVDHGDHVKKGDVLARLQSSDQMAKLAKAKASALSAEAAIEKANATLAKTKVILAQKVLINKRRQELAARQTVSVEAAQEAQKDVDVAAADLAVAEADLNVLRSGLADARAQQQFEQSVLDHHLLRAPFDAIVVERLKEAGSVVKAGDPIFTLVAPETVWVLAHIDESRAGPIALTQQAEVRLRSLPQQHFAGRVERIGIESDRVTEERRVWVRCTDCPADFHLGEQAEVLISVAALPNARLVPETAVQGYDGRKGLVWSIQNGRATRRTVNFGLRTEDARLQVAGDLPDSVAIILDTGSGIAEGRAVRITEVGKP